MKIEVCSGKVSCGYCVRFNKGSCDDIFRFIFCYVNDFWLSFGIMIIGRRICNSIILFYCCVFYFVNDYLFGLFVKKGCEGYRW